jgi:hypothetical protein
LQEAHALECERHKETIEFLDKVLKEATKSSEVADALGNQVIALQAALNTEAIQAAEDVNFPHEQRDPAERLATSSNPKHESIGPSDETGIKFSSSIHNAQLQSSVGGVSGAITAREGTKGGKSKPKKR